MPATLPELERIREATAPSPKRGGWLRRILGMRFLVISIAVHVLLALVAGIWVVQKYTATRKLTFKAGPPSPNPSTRAIEHKVQMAKKQSTMSAPSNKRVVSIGRSKITLPDMPAMPKASNQPAKMAGAGGSGPAANMGAAGPTTSAGGGSLTATFGLRDSHAGTIAGTFYDLKQDTYGKPTEMAISPEDQKNNLSSVQNKAYDKLVGNFIKGGMGEGMLSRYFRGPNSLYTSRIFIPTLEADRGPEAFQLADRVQPRRWIVVYRGKVIAPESGKYSFVGFADDVLAVRLNGQLAVDASLCNPTGQRPTKLYDYDGLGSSLYVGNPVDVTAGTSYPLEIVIGERPGGQFNAFLLLEKQGATYDKSSRGSPILPIFKLGPSDPPTGGGAPQVAKDTSWSIWNAEKQAAKPAGLNIFQKPK